MALIDEIYQAVSDDEVFAHLPAAIAEHCGARSCVMHDFDPDLQLRGSNFSYFTQEMVEYLKSDHCSAWDIWTAYSISPQRFGKISNGDLIWDRGEFKRTAYYNECIRRFGDDTVSVMGGVIQTPDGFLTLGVHRGSGASLFESDHVTALQRLAPHLFRMLDIRARLASAQMARSALARALDQAGLAVLAIDREMRVKTANASAEELIAARDVLVLRRGRLSLSSPDLQSRFAHAVRSAVAWSGSRADAILLRSAKEARSYRMIVSPLAEYNGLALVLIERAEAAKGDIAPVFRRLYGLTATEAALAELLAQGLSPNEAAVSRGVRISTVRTQIKSLLAKTQAKRLSDLVRLLSRLPHP